MPSTPPKPSELICIITLRLESENEGCPSQPQMVAASEALASAIRTRLFGDGFMPHDVFVDSYDLTIN